MAAAGGVSLLARTIMLRAKFQCLPRRSFQAGSVASQGHSPDYYAVLGLNKAATKDQVKLAYFTKAKLYHPDSNPTDEARLMFQLTAEAYDVLSDDKRRKLFDECGTAGFTYGGTSSTGGGPQRPMDHRNYDPEELFDKIFGEAGKSDSEEQPLEFAEHGTSFYGHEAGKEYKINLSFEDAAKGTETQMYLSIKSLCMKCRGSKSELGFTWQVCVYCEGTGIETEKIGHVLTRKTCGYCGGTRKFIKYKCIECEGTGQTISIYIQSVKIPAGCENGQVLKVPVDEIAMRYTVPGSQYPYFYVYVTVEESDDFKREDYDLFSEADISLSQALLGGSISVRGLHKERLQVTVPALTDSNRSLVARGEGILRSDGLLQGNHYVRVGIRPPSSLTSRQRLLWEAFAKLEELGDAGGTVTGVETGDSHKFEVGVIEPTRVIRKFNAKRTVKKGQGDSAANPEKKSGLF